MGRLVRLRQLTGRSPGGERPEASEPFNFTRDVVEALAVGPRRVALHVVDRNGVIERRTFDDIANAAGRWAALLRSRGLAPGDRVLVLVGATAAWPAIVLGSLKAGFVVVPCHEPSSAADVGLLLRSSQARLFVVDGANTANLAGIDPGDVVVVVVEDMTPELRGLSAEQPTHETVCADAALVFYAADATSVAATATHGDMRELRLAATTEPLDPGADDTVMSTLETGSPASIWNGLLRPWAAGAEVVIADAGTEADERFELIWRRVKVLRQASAGYVAMTEHAEPGEHDLAQLRRAVSVGGPLDPDAATAFRTMSGLVVEEEPEPAILVVADGDEEVVADPRQTGSPDPARRPAVVAEAPPAEGPAPATSNGHHPGASEFETAAVVTAAATAARVRADHERREAAAKAQAEERERRQREEAAADEARRAEEDARRAGREQAKADERERKRQQEAAAAKAAADARERKRQDQAAAEQARRAESGGPPRRQGAGERRGARAKA